jgi:hypothetical protein
MKVSIVLAAVAIAVAGGAARPAVAQQIPLHVFQPAERASAADFNANFNNLRVAIEAVTRRNAELVNRVRDLEASLATARQLNGILSIVNVNDVRTVRLTGVNFQVVNGLNRTETVNGAGNILVGYDEPHTFASTKPLCSAARALTGALLDTEADCLAAGEVFGTQHKSGSHNLVLGTQNGYSSFAGIVAGRLNYSNEMYASVLGGVDNRASGRFSAIVTAQGSATRGNSAAILGGIGNQANGSHAAVAGGVGNVANGAQSLVVGGERNEAPGEKAVVLGGFRNVVSGRQATLAGGRVNTVSGTAASLLGGANRAVSAEAASTP